MTVLTINLMSFALCFGSTLMRFWQFCRGAILSFLFCYFYASGLLLAKSLTLNLGYIDLTPSSLFHCLIPLFLPSCSVLQDLHKPTEVDIVLGIWNLFVL